MFGYIGGLLGMNQQQQNVAAQSQAQQSQLAAAQAGTLSGYKYHTITGANSISQYQQGMSNKLLVENTIMGCMHKHNVDKEYFENIKKVIYHEMMDIILNGGLYVSYHELAYNKCEEKLPTWKFNTDIEDLINGDE